MKKHLPLLLACLFFTGSLFAQQHLSFKGIPVDGTLKACTDALVKDGFHYESTKDGTALLTGDFAGYKGCVIGVSTLKNLDVVNHIDVLFPGRDTWSAMLNDYETLKAMLTEKYGTPSDSKENSAGYMGDSGSEMQASGNDGFVYYTTFATELGDIELSIIAGIKHNTGCVRISYSDKTNSEK